MNKINVQIVEDQKLMANSLSNMINESGIALITGVYYDLKSCREGLKKGVPDILLLDVELPDGNGVDFCAEMTKNIPELKVIMLTNFKEFNIAKHALYNGALGYILKNSEPEEMLAGIETVSNGNLFLCEEIDIMLKNNRNEEIIWLTDTEKLVLKYIVEGYTRKQISELLFRSDATIKTHWRNLFVKLKVKNTAQLVKKACDMKYIF